jgi:hypothetical protein
MSRTTRTITTAAVVLALAAPGAAVARPDQGEQPTASTTVDRVSPDARYGVPEPASTVIDRVSPDARYGEPDGSAPAPVVTIPRTRVVKVEQTGFEWGDAAIGGAATLALLLTAGGLVLTVRPRHRAAAH